MDVKRRNKSIVKNDENIITSSSTTPSTKANIKKEKAKQEKRKNSQTSLPPDVEVKTSIPESNIKGTSSTTTSKSQSQPQVQQSLFPKQRVWSRIILVLGVLIVVYFTSKQTKESIFGDFKENLNQGKGFDIKCTFKYTDAIKQFPGVTPINCGRVIVDELIINFNINGFLHIIKKIIKIHFKNLPPPIIIIDIGKWTLNSYKKIDGETELIDLNYIPATKDFMDSFKLVHRRIKQLTKEHYKIQEEKIHLAEPSFITILSGKLPEIDYSSQYTIDQELNNGSFHYSAKIFLSDYSTTNNDGGRFIFADKDNIHRIIHPKKGRAVIYTSGPENIYFIEPPNHGHGSFISLTIGFTGNRKQAFRNRLFLE